MLRKALACGLVSAICIAVALSHVRPDLSEDPGPAHALSPIDNVHPQLTGIPSDAPPLAPAVAPALEPSAPSSLRIGIRVVRQGVILEPVAQAAIRLFESDASPAPLIVAVTPEDGEVSLGPVLPGQYSARVQPPGMNPILLRVQPGCRYDVRIPSAPSQVRLHLRGDFRRTRALTLVVYALVPAVERQELMRLPDITFQQETLLSGLIPGMYSILAWTDDGSSGVIDLSLGSGERIIDLVLQREGWIEGTVVSDETGAPLDHVAIETSKAFGPVTTTDQDGKFRGPLLSGDTVTFSLPGHVSRTLSAVDSGAFDVVRLVRATSARVTVEDEQGEPVAQATVCAITAAGDKIAPVRADLDGIADLGGLSPDAAYTLEARHVGRSLIGETQLPPGRSELRLRMGAGKVVQGRVLDPTGAPAMSSRVLASWVQGNRHESVSTDSDGAFALLLPAEAADAMLMATHWSFAPSESAATSEQRRLELVLRVPRSITGRVLGPDGSPVRDALVTCVDAGLSGAYLGVSKSDAQGSYSFFAVPVTPLNLRAWFPPNQSGTALVAAGADMYVEIHGK